jgi:hypothetical protein
MDNILERLHRMDMAKLRPGIRDGAELEVILAAQNVGRSTIVKVTQERIKDLPFVDLKVKRGHTLSPRKGNRNVRLAPKGK